MSMLAGAFGAAHRFIDRLCFVSSLIKTSCVEVRVLYGGVSMVLSLTFFDRFCLFLISARCVCVCHDQCQCWLAPSAHYGRADQELSEEH